MVAGQHLRPRRRQSSRPVHSMRPVLACALEARFARPDEGCDGVMRASSASGRGASRAARGAAKVVRIPVANRDRWRRLWPAIIAIAAVAVLAAVLIGANSFGRHLAAPTLAADEFRAAESQTIKLVNDARLRAGATPLALSRELSIAARVHSDDMAANGYLAHESADGDTPADRVRSAGIDYEEVAENLFLDNGPDLDALPQRALAEWQASPIPRANLLAPKFRTIAVSIARAVDGSFFVTLDLMR